MESGDEDFEPFFSQEANNEGGEGKQLEHVMLGTTRPNTGNNEGTAAGLDDSVHGTIRLLPVCAAVVATQQFARLRNIAQLGLSYVQFPAALHTRHPHSLGVYHLALRLVDGLVERSDCTLPVTQRDRRNVALAALCHDLGHGPMSHVFEKEFVPLAGKEWDHEDMSIKMFRFLLRELEEDGRGLDVTEEDIQDIKQMIRGVKPEDLDKMPPGRRFLFRIVSNDYDGVDVDRGDYMQRDALATRRAPLSCDIGGLLDAAEVVDGQICYPLSRRDEVWRVYTERVRLFRDVYTHRNVKAGEIMAAEALFAADLALKFSERIKKAEHFVHLDDTLLKLIAAYPHTCPLEYARFGPKERASLDQAGALLRRLTRGDLYLCCGECEVPEAMLLDGSWEETTSKRFTAKAVVSCCCCGPSAAAPCKADDIIVDHNKIDYGKKGGDPMAKVGFFDEAQKPRVKRTLTPEELNALPGRPACLKIRTIRVYVRSAQHLEAASQAFRVWCRDNLGVEPAPTPAPPTATLAGPATAGCGAAPADTNNSPCTAREPYTAGPPPSAVATTTADVVGAPDGIPTPQQLHTGAKRRRPESP